MGVKSSAQTSFPKCKHGSKKRHKNLELSLQIALCLRDSPGYSVTYRAGKFGQEGGI